MTLKGLRLKYKNLVEGEEKNDKNQTQALSHYMHRHVIMALGGGESQNF